MTNEQLLKQHQEAVNLATELFNGIWEDALMWMQTPTSVFFGISPTDAIVSGNGEAVLEWLKQRSGR